MQEEEYLSVSIVKTKRWPWRIAAYEIMIEVRAAGHCVYRNKLDNQEKNICKTNTVIWKETFEDDCETNKIKKKYNSFSSHHEEKMRRAIYQ